MSDTMFLIWSNEHHAWWNPGGHGYTFNREEAGEYTLSEAVEICRNANIYSSVHDEPFESMVPVRG